MSKYIVRDEEGMPFKMQFGSLVSEERLDEANRVFADSFKKILSRYIPENVEIIFDRLSQQINTANEYVAGRNTISLDPFYSGNYRLRISRLFNEGEQKAFSSLVGSDGISIDKQINVIPNGHYVVVEDDSVAVETIREIIRNLKPGQILQDEILKNKYCQSNSLMNIISQLRKGIIVDDVYVLSRHYEDAFDTVDLRDFILGVPYSGLVVNNNLSQTMRKPYIYPFVDVSSRANICKDKQKEFSQEIILLNIKIYEEYISMCKVEDTADSFRAFVRYALNMDCGRMVEICSRLLEMCK